MAATSLSGLAKEAITELAEAVEPHPLRVPSPVIKAFGNLSHLGMISLLVSLSSDHPAQNQEREQWVGSISRRVSALLSRGSRHGVLCWTLGLPYPLRRLRPLK